MLIDLINKRIEEELKNKENDNLRFELKDEIEIIEITGEDKND